MQNKTSKHLVAMTECSIMIALSTVLSIIKLVDMPYGGSVTIASMLPIVIAVFRHGTAWGIGTALVNSAVQLFIGLNTLSYFSTWQSIVAIILLDYIIAFSVFALAGVFKKVEKRQNYAILYGILLSSILRYACHVISGATVWAGLSIPTNAALLYSLSYNATYMVPETIILVAIGIYLTSAVDFTTRIPTRIKTQSMDKLEVYSTIISGLLLVLTIVVDVIIVAPYLQDPDSGEFVFTNLKNINAVLLTIVSIVGIASSLALFIVSRVRKSKLKAI
ncbi:MAG: energy-coupled thiamine transporter ThiT [Clostridia bacterium]|nr:energy-coupled thiamine transporter ThiT [Clostridia bacterium]